jgi:hypothetical protein
MILRYYHWSAKKEPLRGISSAWDIPERKSVEKKTLKIQRDLEAEGERAYREALASITALEH